MAAWLLLPTLLLPILVAGDSRPKQADPPAPGKGWMQVLGDRFEHFPFYIETDNGIDRKARQAYVDRFKGPLIDTANYFLKVHGLDNTCFADYAKHYHVRKSKQRPLGVQFEPLIRLRLFRRYEDFLADFQQRYETKTIPGAFYGRIEKRDEYGNPTGIWLREMATYVEGAEHGDVLRGVYHEMGHLFMDTFMLHQVEVPSWIEEGNAQLLQYRIGNGTNPEEERDERIGHIAEMVDEGSSIPWGDFTKVRNAHNLDFTHQDPLRSSIQYTQSWSAMEFVVGSEARQQAYIKFLRELKSDAKKWKDSIRSEQEWIEGRERILYEKQGAAFKKHFGADMLAIEELWKKDWVLKGYEAQVKQRPVLRYYRGDWQLLRYRMAKDAAAREKAMARAEALFQECIQLSEKLPEGYVGMGRIALYRGQRDEAGQWFDRALTLGATSFEANLYGGIARVLNARSADAIAPLRLALAKRPGHADGNLHLARAIGASATAGTAMAMIDLGLAAARRAREAEPGRTAQAGLIEGALQLLRQRPGQAYLAFLRSAEGYPDAVLYMAIAKAHDNQPEDALALLEKRKAEPTVATLIARLADAKRLPAVGWTRDGQPAILLDGPAAAGEGAAAEDAGKPDAKVGDIFK